MIEKERLEIINQLVSYGLTPVQAQTYLALLKLGSATAKSISMSSDINRVDIYRALRHLKRYGIVEEKLGNPTEFVAADPEQAIDILISSKLRNVDNLRLAKPVLKRKLYELQESGKLVVERDAYTDEMFLKVVIGEQMFRRVQSVVLESKKEIVTIFAPSVMIIYDEMGIPELEASKRQSGVSIRAISRIIPENLDQSVQYSKMVDLRHNDLPPSQLRYTIMDDERLILPVGDFPSKITEGTALWTNSKILISALKVDFESLWSHSIPAKERIEQLLAANPRWKKTIC